MKQLTGRPPDPSTQDLICPRCGNKELRKSGFHYYYTKQGKRKVQMYSCRLCHFITTKPLQG